MIFVNLEDNGVAKIITHNEEGIYEVFKKGGLEAQLFDYAQS